jgi:hypothetical protein
MPLDPKRDIYDRSSLAQKFLQVMSIICIVVGLATLYVIAYSWFGWTYLGGRLWPLYTAIGVWAIVPPLWFWFEYCYLYRTYGQNDTLELFKYGQDVGKAIWAGGVATLIALAASDVVKPDKSSETKQMQEQLAVMDTLLKQQAAFAAQQSSQLDRLLAILERREKAGGPLQPSEEPPSLPQK